MCERACGLFESVWNGWLLDDDNGDDDVPVCRPCGKVFDNSVSCAARALSCAVAVTRSHTRD